MISSFMRRSLPAIVLIAGATLLQGCVYDPYNGGYGPYPPYGYSYQTSSYPAYASSSYPTYAYGPGAVVGGGYWNGRTWNGDWDHNNHQ